MKKVILIFAMVFVAAITFGQTNADVDQTGSNPFWATGLINDASVQQVGMNVDLDVDQVAGDWNGIKSGQNGTNLSITLDAAAGTFNDGSYGSPKGFLQSGMNSDIDIEQVAATGSNTVRVWQQSGLGYIGDNNDIDVVQTAGNSNILDQVQYGQDHLVNLEQTAGGSNTAVTYQGEWGSLQTNNVLYGATLGLWGPLYDPTGPAMQISTASDNTLLLDQNGSNNKVGLYQEGLDFNSADILQDGGDNSLLIYQTNVDGSNSVISSQMGGANNATVYQNTVSGSGTIMVNQQ